jgi:hypothetical protein
MGWEKAFDRVNRNWLISILKEMNFEESFIEYIQLLYRKSIAVVLINGFFSEELKTKSGVRQGCCIAPFLFAIITEPFRSSMKSDNKFLGLIIENV